MSTCPKCNQKGHFSTHCSSKTTAHELSLDIVILGVVTSEQELSWTTTLLLGNREVTFKLAMGLRSWLCHRKPTRLWDWESYSDLPMPFRAQTPKPSRYLGTSLVSSNTKSRSHHKQSLSFVAIRQNSSARATSNNRPSGSKRGQCYQHRWTQNAEVIPKSVLWSEEPGGGIYDMEGAVFHALYTSGKYRYPCVTKTGKAAPNGDSWGGFKD